MRITLCNIHYTGTPYQVCTSDETKCKFCRQELEERMKKFGVYDWQQIMVEDRDMFLGHKKIKIIK